VPFIDARRPFQAGLPSPIAISHGAYHILEVRQSTRPRRSSAAADVGRYGKAIDQTVIKAAFTEPPAWPVCVGTRGNRARRIRMTSGPRPPLPGFA